MTHVMRVDTEAGTGQRSTKVGQTLANIQLVSRLERGGRPGRRVWRGARRRALARKGRNGMITIALVTCMCVGVH